MPSGETLCTGTTATKSTLQCYARYCHCAMSLFCLTDSKHVEWKQWFGAVPYTRWNAGGLHHTLILVGLKKAPDGRGFVTGVPVGALGYGFEAVLEGKGAEGEQRAH